MEKVNELRENYNRLEGEYCSVEVYADTSLPGDKSRMITLGLEYPKSIDAEILTHRRFSRNAGSMRAVNNTRVREMIENDRGFLRPFLGQEKRGMVGNEPLDAETAKEVYELIDKHAEATLILCEELEKRNVHHQQVNRYIEPFLITSRVMTGTLTQWNNFIRLRETEYAEPHIRELAALIKETIKESITLHSQIHIPFYNIEVSTRNPERLPAIMHEIGSVENKLTDSVARAAKISYFTYKDPFSENKNKEFCDKLWKNEHVSPYEHVTFDRFFYPDYDHVTSVYGKYWFSYRTLLELSSNPERSYDE